MSPLVIALSLIFPTFFFLVAASLGFSCSNVKKDTSKLPRGNMSWPLVGETMAFVKPHPSTSIGNFFEQRVSRFGKMFMSHLFGQQTVVSTDVELNRFILQNDSKLFEPGWQKSMRDILGKHSTLVLVGEAHKNNRSNILNFIGNVKLRSLFLGDAQRLATMILSSWKQYSVISMKEEARKFSFYMMAKNILSMMPRDPEVEELLKEFKIFMKAFVSLPLNLPWTNYTRGLKARKNILKFIKQKIEDRLDKMRHGSGEVDQDLLTWVLQSSNLSVEEVGDFLLGMLFGGHETTAVALVLMIYFLRDCPRALEKLQEEHGEISKRIRERGEAGMTWDDYKSLKFTQCVINETLRLGNVAKCVQRKTTADIQFKGYSIPRGLNIMVVLSTTHLDPSLFEDPEHFNPWRWQSPCGLRKDDNFMAFGGGVRSCAGSDLARLEMTVFLHHLITKYKWELAKPDQPLTYPYVDFPNGMPIKVQPLQSQIEQNN